MCVCVCMGALNPVWLRPNGTEALSVTDKRQAPLVKSTWHQASFSLADAKSMTEALAGGRAGGRVGGCPLPAPHSAGLEIQRQASSIRESLFMMMMTISLCLHSALSQSITLFFCDPTPAPPSFLHRLPCILLIFSSLSCPLSQKVHVRRLYLRGAVRQRKTGEGECEKLRV